jgi:hypothetical protein
VNIYLLRAVWTFCYRRRSPRFRAMDDCRSTPLEADRPAETVVRHLRDKRRRFHELLSTQRDQLTLLEEALERQFERLRGAGAEDLSNSTRATELAEFETQRAAIAEEAESLARLSVELDHRQAEFAEIETRLKTHEQAVAEQLARQRTALDERSAEVDSAGTQLRQAQRALAASEEELAGDREQVSRLRERLQKQLDALEQERQNLATRHSDTNSQRRRIARELQHQHHTQTAQLAKEREAVRMEREVLRAEREHSRTEYEQQLAEVDRRREEARLLAATSDGQLQERLESAVTESGEMHRQLVEHKRILNARAEELSSLRAEHAHMLDEIKALRVERDRLLQSLSARKESEEYSGGEAERLRADVEALQAKLAEAETRAANAGELDGDIRKRDDLKRRFELALEDVRDLKRRNAELEEELNATPEGGPVRQSGGKGDKLDWEAQKRQLLASWAADDDDDEERVEERMSIEGTIRITDEIVARKDQELAELKRVLEEQSSNLGTVAVGATAIAEMLDQDELIRQERENLLRLQEEWRQKLRQAEVDISVERARMARERIELDDKRQSLEAQRAKFSGEAPQPGKGESGSVAQRRWWARLGLKEPDQE